MRYLFIIFTFFISAATTPGQDLEVGDKAPDIVMNGLNGKEMQLSSLRGKMVLVDFWASWCRPCRKEHPEIIKTYQEYKNEDFKNGKGFTVFSVSLDNKRSSWEKAIQADQLPWQYHVSDLKGWDNAAARKYGVSSIPQSYLIDGDGIIVAVNPRGGKLENALKKQLNKKGIFSFFDF